VEFLWRVQGFVQYKQTQVGDGCQVEGRESDGQWRWMLQGYACQSQENVVDTRRFSLLPLASLRMPFPLLTRFVALKVMVVRWVWVEIFVYYQVDYWSRLGLTTYRCYLVSPNILPASSTWPSLTSVRCTLCYKLRTTSAICGMSWIYRGICHG
jgi:hypothetical protein